MMMKKVAMVKVIVVSSEHGRLLTMMTSMSSKVMEQVLVVSTPKM